MILYCRRHLVSNYRWYRFLSSFAWRAHSGVFRRTGNSLASSVSFAEVFCGQWDKPPILPFHSFLVEQQDALVERQSHLVKQACAYRSYPRNLSNLHSWCELHTFCKTSLGSTLHFRSYAFEEGSRTAHARAISFSRCTKTCTVVKKSIILNWSSWLVRSQRGKRWKWHPQCKHGKNVSHEVGNSVALLIMMTVSAAESITHECLSHRQSLDTENAIKIF